MESISSLHLTVGAAIAGVALLRSDHAGELSDALISNSNLFQFTLRNVDLLARAEEVYWRDFLSLGADMSDCCHCCEFSD
jgi:hypothetical protein